MAIFETAVKAALDDRCFTLSKRIKHVDAAIDHRFYALYGLTEDEIRTVEGKV